MIHDHDSNNSMNIDKTNILLHNNLTIKTSGSESRPRKVELESAHKKNATTTASILHITTKLVKTPTKQPYRIYIKTSGSESRPRKVELASAHKKTRRLQQVFYT